MFRIKRISPNEVVRIYDFQLSIQRQIYYDRSDASLNDIPFTYLKEYPLLYSASLDLLYAAVLPNTDEILGYIIGHSPGLIVKDTYLKPIDASYKLHAGLRKMYANLADLIFDDYFLLVTAALKEGVDQRNMLSSLLSKLLRKSKEHQFHGAVYLAKSDGLKRFLPLTNFNLIDTVRFKSKEPFTNIYYCSV